MDLTFEDMMRAIPEWAKNNNISEDEQLALLLQGYFEETKKLRTSRDHWRKKFKQYVSSRKKKKAPGAKVPLAQFEKILSERDMFESAYRREFRETLRLLREAKTK